MKKIVAFVTLFALLGLGACRQQQDVQPTAATEFPNVPTAVVQAVKSTYPSAMKLRFSEIDKGNMWESDFELQAVAHQATINSKGDILEAYAVGNPEKFGNEHSVMLPAAAKAYIEKTYPVHKVRAIGEGQHNNQKAYKVMLRTDKEEIMLIFDAAGALVLEFKMPLKPTPETPKTFPILKTDDLPATINQYLKDNGLTFARGVASVGKDAKKMYLVVANKGTTMFELVFDHDGKLVKSNSFTPPPAPVELKSVNDLPAAAIAFLVGYRFEKGFVAQKEGKKFYVVIAHKDGKRYDITFDADGKVLSNKYAPVPVEKAITATAELPASIIKYLDKDYVGWTFVKGSVVLIDSKPDSYSVVVKIGGTLYYFSFNGEGKFQTVRKG